MKKNLILNIVLSLALGGMAATLFAADAAKDAKPAAAASAPAAGAKPADDAKPADTAAKPEDAKPADTAAKPEEAKPADTAAAPAADAKPADTAAAPAAGDKPADAAVAPAADVSASAAPQTVPSFDGKISEIGGAAPDADSAAPEVKHWSDSEVIDRNYFQQPPMIPHKVDEYRITASNNKCMSCHSWENYKDANATKISQTHFKDRDGKDHSTLAARRYFCTQCHVPQVDAPPLVENEFTPVKELDK